jgi:2-octaprenyl-6-methoxyphenol hydroxylase
MLSLRWQSKMQKYDVAIIGAGFVGYTAALALADMGFSTLIIEAKKRDLSQLPQQDGRAIALAYTSCLLLKNLNVWPRLQAQANPIKTVHTSQQGLFGKCRMRASDLNLDY